MKIIDAYIYFAKMKLMTSVVYRFEFFASIIASGMVMFSTVFMWRTVYHAVTVVDGFNVDQMITYSILSTILGMVFNVTVEDAIYERVMQGDIAIDFIRPTNMILCYLAEDIGSSTGILLTRCAPMLLFISIFFYVPTPANGVAFLLFIISTVLSFSIIWIMDAIIGVMHIKMGDLGSLAFAKDCIVLLLSGSIIPIWFLPEKIRLVLSFLPFQYTYQTPLGIYIGKYMPYEALSAMLVQCIWICILLYVLIAVWEKTSKNVLAQGG